MTSRSNGQWYPGMSYPEATDPCKNLREMHELEVAMGNKQRNFGIATVDDPMIIWLCCLPRHKMTQHLIETTNDIAVQAAERANLPYVWVIHEAHDKEYIRGENGEVILDSNIPNKQLLGDTDYHITLRLGTGPYDCVLSAHAWIVLDDDGVPYRLAMKADRTQEYIRYGNGEGITFWPWKAGVQSDYWYDPLGNRVARQFSPYTDDFIADVCIGRHVAPRVRKERPRCGASDDPCHDCQGREEREEAYREMVRDAEDGVRHARQRTKVNRIENPNMIPIPYGKLRIG